MVSALQTELQEAYDPAKTANNPDPALPPSSKRAKSGIWSRFDNDTGRSAANCKRLLNKVECELRSYLKLPCLKRQDDPFNGVESGKKEFPHLYTMAMTYLAIPATSVPCEWLFSVAGDIVSKKRSALTDENTCMLVCLHEYLK